MQFDDFYKSIGVFGRYQKVKYLLICLTYMFPPIMVYTWSFTAATPSFRCRTPLDDLPLATVNDELLSRYIPTKIQCEENQKSISIRECQRCLINLDIHNDSNSNNGQLGVCKNFIFDRTYYQSTLVEEWSMVCDRVSLKSTVQIVFFFGYMIGSLVFGVLSDKYGRRPIMGVSFVLMSIAGFICAFAPQNIFGFGTSYSLFTFGRFLLACATRGIALTGFVIGSEIVGPEQRLFTGIVIEYFFAFGELSLLGLAYITREWRTLHTALAIISMPFILFYFVLPESPRWMLSKGRYDDAEKILRRIAEVNGTYFDKVAYERLTNEEKKRTAALSKNSSGIMVVLRSKIMCIIAINMSFQWFVQNLVFYGVSQNTGAWLINPYVSFAAGALVEIAAYFVVHLVLDRWGRKAPYCSFVMAFAVVSLLVLPIQILMLKDSQGQYVLMFIVNVALKFLASGSYAIIYIYANELFPTQGRNTGMGICSMVARVGAIIGTLSNDMLARAWLHFPILVFGIMSLIAVMFATICPETLHKPLPQTIDDVERMGLAFPLGGSKRVKSVPINANEDATLKEQLKGDVDF